MQAAEIGEHCVIALASIFRGKIFVGPVQFSACV
jgi:hypothetical protein